MLSKDLSIAGSTESIITNGYFANELITANDYIGCFPSPLYAPAFQSVAQKGSESVVVEGSKRLYCVSDCSDALLRLGPAFLPSSPWLGTFRGMWIKISRTRDKDSVRLTQCVAEWIRRRAVLAKYHWSTSVVRCILSIMCAEILWHPETTDNSFTASPSLHSNQTTLRVSSFTSDIAGSYS